MSDQFGTLSEIDQQLAREMDAEYPLGLDECVQAIINLRKWGYTEPFENVEHAYMAAINRMLATEKMFERLDEMGIGRMEPMTMREIVELVDELYRVMNWSRLGQDDLGEFINKMPTIIIRLLLKMKNKEEETTRQLSELQEKIQRLTEDIENGAI